MTPAAGRRRRHLIRTALDALAAAVGFLTALPAPEGPARRGHAVVTAAFPWVGLLLGALALLVRALPVEPLVAAAVAAAALALVTGGLHWDGWADVLDATVTPGVARARRIEILQDPRVGAHAAVGIALLALLRVLALARSPVWGVLVGAVLGRWTMVATLRWAPPLGESGTGARLRADARPMAAAVCPVALVIVLLSLGVPARNLAAATGVAAAAAVSGILFVVGRLGGMNGDGHGAIGILVESVVWTAAAELAPWGSVQCA